LELYRCANREEKRIKDDRPNLDLAQTTTERKNHSQGKSTCRLRSKHLQVTRERHPKGGAEKQAGKKVGRRQKAVAQKAGKKKEMAP